MNITGDTEHFTKQIVDTARELYGEKITKPKKPWITQITTDLINTQQKKHRDQHNYEQEWDAAKEVKKQARKDRKQCIRTQLEEHPQAPPSQQWKGVKMLLVRKPAAFKNTQLEHKGKLTPIFESAEGTVSHLKEPMGTKHK